MLRPCRTYEKTPCIGTRAPIFIIPQSHSSGLALRCSYILRFSMLRPFVMRDFFLRLQTEIFFFQGSFSPVKRGNRAGSSRNESDYSRRGTQISFPLLESRSCENLSLIHI